MRAPFKEHDVEEHCRKHRYREEAEYFQQYYADRAAVLAAAAAGRHYYSEGYYAQYIVDHCRAEYSAARAGL